MTAKLPTDAVPKSESALLARVLKYFIIGLPLMLLLGGGGYLLGGAAWAAGAALAGLALAVALDFGTEAESPSGGAGVRDGRDRRQGLWVWRDRHGRVRCEAQFQDDRRHGPAVTYHADGRRATAGSYHENQRDGEWLTWDAAGVLRARRHHVADEQDGEAQTWYANGQPESAGAYRQGRRVGGWVTWHANGQKRSEIHYDDDRPRGAYRLWHPNGQRRLDATYRDGELHGPVEVWDGQGRPRRQAHYLYGLPLGRSAGRVPEPARRVGWVRALLWVALLAVIAGAFVRDIGLAVGVLLLTLGIAWHELGHFLAAGAVGIPIKRFRVGLGPALLRFHGGRTRYELSVVPLLGYVEEYQLRPGELAYYFAARAARRRGEPVPPEPADASQGARAPVSQLMARWRRLVYLLGGVTFNLSLAAILIALVFCLPHLPPRAAPRLLTPQEFRDPAGPWEEDQHEQRGEGPGDLTLLGRIVTEEGWLGLAIVFGAVNLALGASNLLPIPPLDGFHGLRTLVEMSLRRPLPEHYLLPFQLLGLALLLVLMLMGLYDMAREVLRALFH